MKKQLPLCILLLLSVGCASVADRIDNSQEIAASASMERSVHYGQYFNLVKFSRVQDRGVVNIYIEGDGLAWLNKRTISRNPTPKNPLALKLAAVDSSKNVVYFARPCQFTNLAEDKCAQEYWTNKRFAPEVVDEYMRAFDDLGFKQVNLVGFSGGGAIATILAAKRKDVISLTTVAGNLDSQKFVELHRVSEMYGSLNPRDYAEKLGALKQVHLVGSEDKVITPEIYKSFSQKLPDTHNSKIQVIDGLGHGNGWEDFWTSYLLTPAK